MVLVRWRTPKHSQPSGSEREVSQWPARLSITFEREKLACLGNLAADLSVAEIIHGQHPPAVAVGGIPGQALSFWSCEEKEATSR